VNLLVSPRCRRLAARPTLSTDPAISR